MKITLCGLAATGKSTISRLVAHELNLVYVDLGLIFRAFGYLLKEWPVMLRNSDGRVEHISYHWDGYRSRVCIDNRDCTEELGDENVALRAAEAMRQTSNWEVRHGLCECILEPYEHVICDGRNAGNEFLPHAEMKFALVADIKVRVQRRFDELKPRDVDITLEKIEKYIAERDTLDMGRTLAPYKIPTGAKVIDTTHLNSSECVEKIMEIIYHASKRYEL